MQELSAAAKKKLKKKAKEKAKKAGGAAEDPAEAAEAEEEQQAAPAAAAPKKGGKKVSAAVRRMQEALERQEQEAREAAEREAERKAAVRTPPMACSAPCDTVRSCQAAQPSAVIGMGLKSRPGVQEEEAARRAEEEEARLAAEKEQRKAERAVRRAEAKRQGLLLTGKAKKEAERLAALREQLLRNSGVDVGGVSPGEGYLRGQALACSWYLQREPPPCYIFAQACWEGFGVGKTLA